MTGIGRAGPRKTHGAEKGNGNGGVRERSCGVTRAVKSSRRPDSYTELMTLQDDSGDLTGLGPTGMSSTRGRNGERTGDELTDVRNVYVPMPPTGTYQLGTSPEVSFHGTRTGRGPRTRAAPL